MTVVFASNYYNHHQASLACALDELTDHHFYFIETAVMSESRRQMGYGMESIPAFVLQAYRSVDEYQRCKQLAYDADIVIWGECPMEMIRPRLKKKKLTFCYSERIFKKGFKGIEYWGRVAKYIKNLGLYQKNHYLLCASAYASGDYNRIGLFRGRAYRWGYFPEVKEYDVDSLLVSKTPNSLLWAGRFLNWKHPEQAIEVARRLREDGISFEMNIIGDGSLGELMKKMVSQHHLEDCVHLLGFRKPEDVRRYMEQSELFLFTSDQNEGWGAVLNESMNSGCIVIANEQIGSVPYIVQSGVNSIAYTGETDELYQKVKEMLEQKEKYAPLGRQAYQTMHETWNAKTAAQRLLHFAETLEPIYTEGPMSLAIEHRN